MDGINIKAILDKSLKHVLVNENIDAIDNLVIYKYNNNKNITEETISDSISYYLENNRIIVNYKDNSYALEKEPFCFYNEDNKLLGKTYCYSLFRKTLELVCNDYDIYFEDKVLTNFKNIIYSTNRKFTLKKKIMFKYLFFDNLNKKIEFYRNNNNNNIKINLKELSPIPFTEFNFNDKNIDFILENRNKLISEIIDFMDTSSKILKIYGCDGIGKSATYIYLSYILNSFNVLYFNLKKIYSYKEKLKNHEIYKFELMRYFTANKDINLSNKLKQEAYKQYLDEIQNVKEESFDFWDELLNFVKRNKYNRTTIIILDQYLDKYDSDINFTKLIKLILCSLSSFKLLISYSINNYFSKYSLAQKFECCANNIPKIFNDTNIVKKQKESTFEQKFEGIELDKPNNYDAKHDDNTFKNIYSLNFIEDYNNESKNSNIIKNEENKTNEFKTNDDDQKENNNITYEKIKFDEIITKNENDIDNNKINNIEDYYYTNENIRILYINELISLQKIEDKRYINYLKLFNYNPKYYIKFKNYISKFQNESMETLFKNFLEETCSHIYKKIKEYYSHENNLKYEFLVELMNLKYLVDKKVKFSSSSLIDYIKRYPIKYIKIKIENNNQTIIDLNEQFNNSEFYLEYCFPFFGLILSKIIFMKENFSFINYVNLSGSARGSFFEEKFKRSLVYEECFGQTKFNLRYVWDFFSNAIDRDNNINHYDYTNFKQIEYDENLDSIILNVENYYIVPGNQINRNIDSAILIPESFYHNFILIAFQIKQGETFEIKEKSIYIKYSFLAKRKFEKLYNIKISKVYFYFVLPLEFKYSEEKEDKKELKDLLEKKIEYIFYSFQCNQIFIQEKEEKLELNELLNEKAQIFDKSNYMNEEENLETKNKLIKELEQFLKRKRYNGLIISRNIFENGRKVIFNRDKGIRLTNTQRKKIIDILSSACDIQIKFTIKYIFKIKKDELCNLSNYKDLLGLFSYNKAKYIYFNS